MIIATWNLNNRVGNTTFRPEAANAAIALNADVLVLNEYYPQHNEAEFSRVLYDAGWLHQQMSSDTGVKANRVLIASRHPLIPLEIPLPDFDLHYPANVLCVGMPSIGISIMGVRVPWYDKQDAELAVKAWDWLEKTASTLVDQPAIILGDLNVGLKSYGPRGGNHFRRILQSGWHRAVPKETASFFSSHGQQSEIDHILGTGKCQFQNTHYVTEFGGYVFAGGKQAISDHAALLAEVAHLDQRPQGMASHRS